MHLDMCPAFKKDSTGIYLFIFCHVIFEISQGQCVEKKAAVVSKYDSIIQCVSKYGRPQSRRKVKDADKCPR